MRNDWIVTYEIVTPESAEYGDCESSGFIWENCTLRQAIDSLFETRTNHVCEIISIEANDSNVESARWITVYNGMEYLTGAYESRAIHIPDSITDASRLRLAKLIDCYGV